MMLPPAVAAAHDRAAEHGFALSCGHEAGALLATLAAAVPPGGRILELGTGVGVGLAWIVTGLGARTDVEVHSVEMDPLAARIAATTDWPDHVILHVGDALEYLPALGLFDLVFADAQGGKTEGLDLTLAALAPAGQLLVDDMAAKESDAVHASLWPQLQAVRERLMGDPGLQAAELHCGSGFILATRCR